MRIIQKLLEGNGENIMRKSAIWNLVSSVEYSLQSALLLLVVTRVNGLYDAGVFTIVYTVTQMMATIGSYGMRSFQVSDIKKEYSFDTYFTSRIVSVLAMALICFSYAAFQGYDAKKMTMVVILCLYRVVEDIEDVLHGEMQKAMRLDIASKIVSIRIFAATLAFCICYCITKDLVISCIFLTVTAAVLSAALNAAVSGGFSDISLKLSGEKVIRLLWVCLPLCLSGYLYNYLVNAPKYAIDRNLSEETQSIFSILFMPIFAINMLSSFIFKPMIASMGITWNNNEKKRFAGSVFRQMLIIVGLTFAIVAAGVIVGIDILGWMYGVDLAPYRALFGILLVFGGFAAMAAFLVVVLTIIRKQYYIIFAYAIAVIMDIIIIDRMVIRHGIWGAGMAYGLTMGVIMALLLGVLGLTLYRERGSRNERKGC